MIDPARINAILTDGEWFGIEPGTFRIEQFQVTGAYGGAVNGYEATTVDGWLVAGVLSAITLVRYTA